MSYVTDLTAVNADDLAQAIREVVAENPDEIYEKPVREGDLNSLCVYFDDEGNPSCLIGQGLARCGMTYTILDNLNAEAVDELFDEGVINEGAIPREWFTILQDMQDMQHSWGASLEEADSASGEGE